MRTSWTETERWSWYAAGDESIAPRAVPVPVEPNSTASIFWEMGLVFAVPLFLAVLAYALPG